MKRFGLILLGFLAAGCSNDDLSWLSIMNDTSVSIFALPYSSDYTDGGRIPPGGSAEFYSIGHESLDAYAFFSLYYDSLIVYIQDHEDYPVKFYQDGTTVNYDATLNPFSNPDVWKERKFKRHLPGSSFNALEEKRIFEHFYCIEARYVKSLSDTIVRELHPAP